MRAVTFVFRGTLINSSNVVTDLTSVVMTPYAGEGCSECNVAYGFQNAWLTIQDEVRSAMRALLAKHPGAATLFTGHSLGAALTVLAAADLATTFNIAPMLITFGNPRVGDANFHGFFNTLVPPQNSTRLVNNDDIVPHLPSMEPLGFQHEETEVWYQASSKQYITCSRISIDTNEDPSCSDSVPFYDYSIPDHLTYMGWFEPGWPASAACKGQRAGRAEADHAQH